MTKYLVVSAHLADESYLYPDALLMTAKEYAKAKERYLKRRKK